MLIIEQKFNCEGLFVNGGGELNTILKQKGAYHNPKKHCRFLRDVCRYPFIFLLLSTEVRKGHNELTFGKHFFIPIFPFLKAIYV